MEKSRVPEQLVAVVLLPLMLQEVMVLLLLLLVVVVAVVLLLLLLLSRSLDTRGLVWLGLAMVDDDGDDGVVLNIFMGWIRDLLLVLHFFFSLRLLRLLLGFAYLNWVGGKDTTLCGWNTHTTRHMGIVACLWGFRDEPGHGCISWSLFVYNGRGWGRFVSEFGAEIIFLDSFVGEEHECVKLSSRSCFLHPPDLLCLLAV